MSCCNILTSLQAIQKIHHPTQRRIREGFDALQRHRSQPIVIDGGLFFVLVIMAEQVIYRYAVQISQNDGGLKPWDRLASFPGEDGLLGNAELLTQLQLGETHGFAEYFEAVLSHRITS